MLKRTPFVLVALLFCGVLYAQSPADTAKIDEFRAYLKAIEPQLTPDGVTRARSLSTSLGNLKQQFKAVTTTPVPPVYVVQSVFDALVARVAKLESGTPPPPPPVDPPPPTGPVEICGNGLDDDKDGQIDEGCIPTPPPSADAFAYYDTLCKTPGALCYSLREQAMIDRYRHAAEVKVNYDPLMQAAKWQWIKDDESADNLRLPISLTRPASGSRRILIISDHRWDTGWFTEFKKPDGSWMGGFKWLQVTGGKSLTDPEQRISFEPRMRVIGEWAEEHPLERDVVALFDAREYLDVRAPTTSYAYGCGVSFGQEVIGINGQMGCFKARANRWTRAFVEIIVTAGDEFVKASFWMADEEQEPVAIFRNAEVRIFDPIGEFWYEYNTSVAERLGGPMAAWGRNVIVLNDVADPTPLLQKPVK